MTEPAFDTMPPLLDRGMTEEALRTSSRSMSRRTLLSFSAKAGAWKAARSALITDEEEGEISE